jgi:hypothetical protein
MHTWSVERVKDHDVPDHQMPGGNVGRCRQCAYLGKSARQWLPNISVAGERTLDRHEPRVINRRRRCRPTKSKLSPGSAENPSNAGSMPLPVPTPVFIPDLKSLEIEGIAHCLLEREDAICPNRQPRCGTPAFVVKDLSAPPPARSRLPVCRVSCMEASWNGCVP